MKAFNTVKYSLLRYSYTGRLHVLEHFFACNGNGMDWVDGQLVSWGRGVGPEVNDEYVETQKIIPYLKDPSTHVSKETKKLENTLKRLMKNSPVGEAAKLRKNIEKINRRFLEKNIDEIAANPYFDMHQHHAELKSSYYVDNPSEGYVLLFEIPDDVQKDWGEAAIQFAQAWIQYFMRKNMGFYPFNSAKDKKLESIDNWSDRQKREFLFIEKLKVLVNKIQANIGAPITGFTDESEAIEKLKKTHKSLDER